MHYPCVLNRSGHVVLRRQKFCPSCPSKVSYKAAKHSQVLRQAVQSLPRDTGPASGTGCELEPVLLII